jgi:uncharacterized protein YndB with AHSA1/START domain
MSHTPQPSGGRPPRLTLERTPRAPIEEIWALWTTKAGFESWWGPDGFSVTVRSLDLRPDGILQYAMTATAPEQVAYMKRAGLNLTTETTIVYKEVVPLRRLAYVNLIDFVPGVGAYDVATQVELIPVSGAVRMAMTFDPMHDESWTRRMISGWEGQLDKLSALIGSRADGGRP